MKKLLLMILVFIFAFALCSCGGDLPATADPNEDAMVAEVEVPDATDPVESDDSGSSSSFSCDGDPIVAFGPYTCYDRFSGEQVGGNYIHVHDSDSTKVVFNYICSSGDFYDITAELDSSQHATVYLTDTLYLEMTFDQSSIYVDEIEGMGAMAYEYRH